MKKRSLTALGLALALTLSLAAPALAAEEPAPADYVTVDMADLTDAALDPAYLETSLEEETYSEFTDRFFEEYTAAHPEEYAAFDPHAYWQEDYGDYWDSEEEFIDHMVGEGYWDSADDFGEEMWNTYLWDKADEAWYAQQTEAYRAAHPGELEALTQEQLLSWQGYTQTLTPAQQFMEDWGLDSEEEIMPTLLRGYVSDREWVAEAHALALEYQAQYPEQWGSFDADAYFTEDYWGDDKAEYMAEGHLFTEEEFAEQMFVFYVDMHSWEWDYEGEDWYDPDDWYYPDDEPKPLTLVVNGQQVVQEGDGTLYAINGVSYADINLLSSILGVPVTVENNGVRAAAEAAGWDVGWNPRSNTIYLLDGETLKAQYAESMAALDAVLDWALEHTELEKGQSYKTTQTLDLTLTMLDSLDGDKDYSLRVTVETLQRDGVIELTAAVNAADLLRLLGDDLVEALTAEMPKFNVQTLKTMLGGVKLNAILDLEQGDFYFNAPILSLFDESISEDTWYTVSAGAGVDELLTEETGMTLRDLLADLPAVLAQSIYQDLVVSSEYVWSTPEEAFQETESTVALLRAIAGPDTLKQSGSTLTWSVDTKTMNAAFSEILGVEAAAFKTYELKYVMKADGSFTCDVSARPDMQGLAQAASADSYYYTSALSILTGRVLGMFDFQVEGHSQGTMEKVQGSVEYHQKNAFKLNMETKSERVKTTKAPAATPPEGAVIVEF